jgi:acyl-CoA thioester hydrolase
MNSTRQPFEVELYLPVRTYDIDFAGIVSNIVYVRWLEDLRLEMLAHHFPLNEQLQQGIAPIILQTKIDYKQSIKLADQPLGKIWMKALESLRWTISAEFSVNTKVVALGEQAGIFINMQTHKPIRIPELLKQKYQQQVKSTD